MIMSNREMKSFLKIVSLIEVLCPCEWQWYLDGSVLAFPFVIKTVLRLQVTENQA